MSSRYELVNEKAWDTHTWSAISSQLHFSNYCIHVSRLPLLRCLPRPPARLLPSLARPPPRETTRRRGRARGRSPTPSTSTRCSSRCTRTPAETPPPTESQPQPSPPPQQARQEVQQRAPPP